MYDRTQELNGYRGTDLSKYVGQGFSNVEDITQELDTGEIVLYGYPYQVEFAPETKFIVDILEDGDINETLHRIVQKDLVSQPELVDTNYYDHHISLIEPSAVAQKRLVDNISATYKLKDVSLKQEVAYDLNEDAVMANQTSQYIPTDNFGFTQSSGGTGSITRRYRIGKYFEYEGEIEILDPNGQTTGKKYRNIQDFLTDGNYRATFRIPKIKIYGGLENSKNFAFLGYASVGYKIEEFSLTDSYNPTNSWNGAFISNSNLAQNSSFYQPQQRFSEWLYENHGLDKWRVRKYTVTSATTPTYITQQIPLQADKQYKISVFLYEFPDTAPESFVERYNGQPTLFNYTRAYKPPRVSVYTYYTEQETQVMDSQSQMLTGFVTYAADTGTLVFSSSVPYSALSLLQKAVMNCYVYDKKPNVYIGDINNNDVPFYVDPNFVDELRETKIIENFYNQKNLWEVLVEVGNYIHAIPELKFGGNDRFVITFNKLGRTEQYQSKNTRISIMNSKGIEDYVSACSSYVTNMVQLGGYIAEWVAPKTSDETYLVSNDTAEILVTKPIIELLQIRVKCNEADGSGITAGSTADLTPFIYEENVYKTLSLNKNVNPNRGIAMYYSLGSNKITGGDYQLPRPNNDAYTQYAFKKIIYCAFFGYSASYGTTADWNNIKINNYSFYVVYRTKDSVRQDHSRPDLRKYLVNSIFDKAPQHNQFNNQQDVVVDSIKFGNNMYGKLIRTGNSNYTQTEWSNNFEELKHKGELYNINGELYYVAKAHHIFYTNHIISEIEYSKDYNQLSPIIGIPSEPRFYEISEQSLIKRDVSINDYFLVTDDYEKLEVGGTRIRDFGHLGSLIFDTDTPFLKYVVTTFKGDKDVLTYDQSIGTPNFFVDIFTPVNAYSSGTTLTYEWDTIDNFSAGDQVVDVEQNTQITTDERAYKSLKAVQYTDIYGKAALFDFYLLENDPAFTPDMVNALPESPITTRQDEPSKIYIGDRTQVKVAVSNVDALDTDYNGRGLGLLKDCREALSFNYNIQAITTSDTFVISPFFFLPDKQNISVVLLSEEVNKLSNGYLDTSKIITPYDTNGNPMTRTFPTEPEPIFGQTEWGTGTLAFAESFSALENVNDGHFTDNGNYQRVKAIAIICNVSLDVGSGSSVAPTTPNKTQFILARNIPSSWTKEQAIKSWWFGAPNGVSVFNKRQ